MFWFFISVLHFLFLYPTFLSIDNCDSINVALFSLFVFSIILTVCSCRLHIIQSLDHHDADYLIDKQELQGKYQVAVDWASWRHSNTCSCGKSFDAAIRHCYQCGSIKCVRCIRRKALPGLATKKAVPVCCECHP